MLLLSALSPAELKTFTLSELLFLPLTVEHPELQQTYFLAGITFHLPNHFVCALRYNNGWMLYDGLKETVAKTLPNVLKSIAEQKGMLGAIVYLRQD
uniref:Ubiquitinyl hydrolase 1 n=1 Tax=Panagrolaimus davidi TaxID=227884 RepID=A0A914Q2J1_9BILA